MEEKYVYVIYDPLYEKVVCVHNEQDMECDVCKLISKDRQNAYFLKEDKHLIKSKHRFSKSQLIKT